MSSGLLNLKMSSKYHLMKNEQSYEIMTVKGTTAVTFFRGDISQAAETIRNRFVEVARENPWVVGSLESIGWRLNIQPHCVCLTSPFPGTKHFEDACARALLEEGRGLLVQDAVVEADMSFEDICSVVNEAGAVLEKGSSLIDDPSKVASRITIIPGGSGDTFAFVFSMSHVIADGYTFYKILSMMSSDTQIEAMEAQRNNEAIERTNEVLGDKETRFMTSFPQVLNWAGRIGCRPREKWCAFKIDKLKTRQAKAVAVEETGADVPFVSTNDIITSSCESATNFTTRFTTCFYLVEFLCALASL